MKIEYRQLLAEGREKLQEATPPARRSSTPYLDAMVLLCHRIGIGREALYRQLTDAIEPEDPLVVQYRADIEARAGGTPVAYLVGSKEFWGLDLEVGPGVLIPRPDTETLVEAALEALGRAPDGRIMADAARLEAPVQAPRILDLCTGSGAVGIALANEIPDAEVSISDISEDALAYARPNAERIVPGRIRVLRGDLFEPCGQGDARFDVITANPPYVASGEYQQLLAHNWGEPPIALEGGPDGLELIRRLVSEAPQFLREGGSLHIEAGIDQTGLIGNIMRAAGFTDIKRTADLSGRPRVTSGRIVA